MIEPKKIRGAIVWTSGAAVDADGAPNAYRLDDTGLDDIRDAQNHEGWVGAVTDNGLPTGKPLVQGNDDPCPGALISPTSLRDHAKKRTDPTAYVDATQVPYLAISPELRVMGVRFGDLAVAVRGDRQVGLICADGGTHNHYGEVSIAAAVALGIPSSPRNGGCSGGVTFYVFPGTALSPAPPWPRDVDEIEATASALFSAWKAGAAGAA